MDAQRALLDELMGVSRDGERQEYFSPRKREKQLVKRVFSDSDVCKYYIQGFCFMEEFQRTKHSYGECDKVHDEECKAQWEALDTAERQKYPYERDLWEWIEKMMSDLRAKVKRNSERISTTTETPLMASDLARLGEIDAEIKTLVHKSEELGETGDVDAAQAAATRADRLKTERVAFEAEAKGRAQDAINRYGEQEVCPYSGVIINNEESRLRDHKSGKNYRTWVHVHEKKKEMENRFAAVGGQLPRGGSAPHTDRRAGGHRESWDRGRHRDPDRDRDREHTRHRDAEWDRRGGTSLERHASRDGYHDSEKYSSRSRQRHRERSRERDRCHR